MALSKVVLPDPINPNMPFEKLKTTNPILIEHFNYLPDGPMTARISPGWTTPETSLSKARFPIETDRPVK